jgi:tetratricopeptide (TPR) repeat protein
MAQVFLSYDREDAPRARLIAQALERAGHFVWWDLHIKGGAEYGREIEAALEKSDAVVVLWSRQSVDSAWVRDEAAAGRDSGRLIPVLIEPVNPPMGFRQYQSLDFSAWNGRGKPPRMAELLDSIEANARSTANAATAPTAPARKTPATPPRKASSSLARWALIGAVVMATLVALGVLLDGRRGPTAPVVTVASADTNASSRQLARDLFVKLGTLQATDIKPIELVDDGTDRKPDFRFQVAGSQMNSQFHASVTLTSEDRTLLWSKDFEVPASQIGDLKQQVALSAARVLECATQATSSGDLDQPTLRLYLNGCATLSGLAGNDFRALVPVFRRVTKTAPGFEGGWRQLLLAESYMVGWETLPPDSPEAGVLRKDIAEARRRFPQIPEAYWADYLLNIGDFGRKARIIDAAAAAHPDNSLLLSMRSGFLFGVGRLAEAVEAAKRAAELNPLSPDETSGYINVLGWAGKTDLAEIELEKAERMWPGARNLVDARWRHHLRFGDPKEALKITRSEVNPGYGEQESYLLARIDPSQANIERAIADAKSRIGREPRATSMLIQTLAEFGREEEIFALLDRPRDQDVGKFGIDAFFRPAFRRFRQDPRFIRVAQKYGLVDYWRSSGKWPDFCFEPDLPYDCKAEAAKLAKAG